MVLSREMLTRVHAKQISTENAYTSENQRWRSHKWPRSLNRHREEVHTLSGRTAAFTVWSDPCIQTKRTSLNVDNFIFPILLK